MKSQASTHITRDNKPPRPAQRLAFLALRDIYLSAGLSMPHAILSAQADLVCNTEGKRP